MMFMRKMYMFITIDSKKKNRMTDKNKAYKKASPCPSHFFMYISAMQYTT